jgi:hypothetical protein
MRRWRGDYLEFPHLWFAANSLGVDYRFCSDSWQKEKWDPCEVSFSSNFSGSRSAIALMNLLHSKVADMARKNGISVLLLSETGRKYGRSFLSTG